MASFQNTPINKEETQCSPSSGLPATTQGQPYPPPETGYPTSPAIGYPAYPPPGYPNNYNSGLPPLPLPLQEQQQEEEQKIRNLSAIFRAIVAGLIFFFLFACIISIITWLVLHPAIPIFHVNNLQVSDFKISPPPNFLTANWILNVTARNPNDKLEIHLDDIDVFMIYNDEYLVGSTTSAPFVLNRFESYTMVVKLAAANNSTDDSDEFKEKEMERMAAERSSSGKVSIELRMLLWGTFRSGHWWERHVLIRVFCEGLEVAFRDNNSTNGSLGNANFLSDCLVYA